MSTTTPAARLTRLLAEGARILAVQGNDDGIDITHDVQGLLAELERLAAVLDEPRTGGDPPRPAATAAA